tara:strand:+ start:1109 stop:1972 length:864 start_codon:yes stop_codon:yes gene_type:complete
MNNTKDYKDKVLQKIDDDLQDSDESILKLKEQSEVTVQTTGKKLNYGKSRWDFEKKRSLERGAYHFDWTKKDKIEDVLMFHGNVDMDCEYFINTYGDKALDNAVHWATRNKSVGGNYAIDQEVYDIVRSGGDPEGKIYGRANMFTDPKAIALAEGLFGLYDYELKLHSQVCGQLLHMHMDNFAARLDRQNSFDELDYDVDPKKVHRFVVFLNDWSMGQIWHQGTAVHTHWKAGDVISWHWQDFPHGTANMGWDTRYILQYTGRTTDKTWNFIENTNKDSKHKLNIHS